MYTNDEWNIRAEVRAKARKVHEMQLSIQDVRDLDAYIQKTEEARDKYRDGESRLRYPDTLGG